MSDLLVQRGTNDIGNSGGTQSITAVSSLTSAFEYNSNSMFTHGGNTASGGNQEGDDMSGAVELTATGTLTFTRQSGSLANNMRFDWQVIEYVGDPGGDNEFIVRSRNTVALNGVATNTVSLDTTPTNIDKCIPFITGVLTNDTGNGGEKLRATAHINDSGSLVVDRGQTANNVTVQVVVVEFTGSNWDVYHGTATSSADTGSITLNTDSDGGGGSTGDVTDWATALIEGQFTSNDQGLDSLACRYNRSPTDTTQVDWDFQSGNSTSHQHFVHVLKHADLTVTRYFPSGSNVNDTNVDITSAGLSDITEAMIIGTCQGSGGGTAYGRNWRNYRLTTTTNAQHYCHRSGNTIFHNIQVIDFSGIVTSGGSPQTVNIGLQSETETELSITAVPGAVTQAIGLNSETETELALTASGALSQAIGLNADTESLFGLTSDTTLTQALDLITETETELSFTYTGLLNQAIGLNSESESLFSLTLDTTSPINQPIGLITEPGNLFSLSVSTEVTSALGLVSESENSLPFTLISTLTQEIGLNSESESVPTLILSTSLSAAIGLITESDVNLPFSTGGSTIQVINLISESETTLSLTAELTLSQPLGLISDTEVIFGFTSDGSIQGNVNLITETESLLPFTIDNPVSETIGIVSDAEIALPISSEESIAQPLSLISESENNLAFSFSTEFSQAIGLNSETEDLITIIPELQGTTTRLLGLINETETLFGFTSLQDIFGSIGIAQDLESLNQFTINLDIPVGLNSETETLLTIDSDESISIPIGLNSEVESLFEYQINVSGILNTVSDTEILRLILPPNYDPELIDQLQAVFINDEWSVINYTPEVFAVDSDTQLTVENLTEMLYALNLEED